MKFVSDGNVYEDEWLFERSATHLLGGIVRLNEGIADFSDGLRYADKKSKSALELSR